MTADEAFVALTARCDLTARPEITPDEAANALEATKRYVDRADSTTVIYGARVGVSGRLYQCKTAGTTAATAPTSMGWRCYGLCITDGTAVWEDIGAQPRENYDIQAAKRLIYTLRIERTAHFVNQSDKDVKTDIESLHKHWVAERAKLVSARAV